MYKEILKVVVLGNAGVGKTAIRKRYLDNTFQANYRITIGADFITKFIKTKDGRRVTLQIWDTAGQERFQSLSTAFYRGADCCILVYDVTDPDSFNNITKWMQSFLHYANITEARNFPFILLGNKIDLNSDRVITKGDGLKLAVQLRMECESSDFNTSTPVVLANKLRNRFSRESLLTSTAADTKVILPATTAQRTSEFLNGWSFMEKHNNVNDDYSIKVKNIQHDKQKEEQQLDFYNYYDNDDSIYHSATEDSKVIHNQDSYSSSPILDISRIVPVDELSNQDTNESNNIQQEEQCDYDKNTPSTSVTTSTNVDDFFKHSNGFMLSNRRSSLPHEPPKQPNMIETSQQHQQPSSIFQSKAVIYEKSLNIPLFECSAKENIRVEDPFQYIADNVIIPKFRFELDFSTDESIYLDSPSSKKGYSKSASAAAGFSQTFAKGCIC